MYVFFAAAPSTPQLQRYAAEQTRSSHVVSATNRVISIMCSQESPYLWMVEFLPSANLQTQYRCQSRARGTPVSSDPCFWIARRHSGSPGWNSTDETVHTVVLAPCVQPQQRSLWRRWCSRSKRCCCTSRVLNLEFVAKKRSMRRPPIPPVHLCSCSSGCHWHDHDHGHGITAQ